MKRKIKVTDAKTGESIESEVTLRNLGHFEVQRTTRAHVFEDRKKKAKSGYRKRKKRDLSEN